MATTNFGLLTDEQLTLWAMDTWKQARNASFLSKFMGTGPNSMIHKVDELKKDKKGARAVVTLVPDMEGDGVAGDRTLKGNEEALKSYDTVIRLDQLRNANKHEGRMADQKSVVTFRKESRDVLAYWMADRADQLGFLTLAGIAYSKKPDGASRVGSDLPYLEFAADVVAPSSKRIGRVDAAAPFFIAEADDTNLVAADTLSWNALVYAKAYAKEQYIRPIRGDDGMEVYHVFVHPRAMAGLKTDSNFLASAREALPRSKDNPLFSGGIPTVDGLVVHEYRHVPNTTGTATKYGGGSIEGCQVLMCGAQALAFADIGNPFWVEETDDYKNQEAISIGKIFGMLKPQFVSQYAGGTVQDFGVLSIYTAI